MIRADAAVSDLVSSKAAVSDLASSRALRFSSSSVQ